MDCCTVFCVIIGIIIFAVVAKDSADKADKENARQERIMEEKKSRYLWNLQQYEDIKAKFSELKLKANSIVAQFFSNTDGSYSSTYQSLINVTNEVMATSRHLQQIDGALRDNSIGPYNSRHMDIVSKEKEIYSYIKDLADKLQYFYKTTIDPFPRSIMMDAERYGKINKSFMEEIQKMEHEGVVILLKEYGSILSQADLNSVANINLEDIVKCIWFLAMEKDYSASLFAIASNILERLCKYTHTDVIIADYYAKKRLGGEAALADPVRALIKSSYAFVFQSDVIMPIASSLMWMGAYQTEHTVLQHMLTEGMTMSPKMQERLHALTNGGGKAPSGFDVASKKDELYFDVSALAWRDEEYAGLFENLAFQDKTLAYSLAVREENKDIVIAQGLKMPTADAILEKMNAVFDDEYGSDVRAKEVKCIALSGSGEEKLDGILAVSNVCPQMGVLIHVAKIGKRLIIKFYTIFIPSGADLATQKQKALSLYKKLSPTVAMWENSMKDVMLIAMEQLLNTSAQTFRPDHDTTSEEPVF